MALITWASMLSVGVKEIDEQHKKLVELINQLNDAMLAGKGREALGRILGELASYTQYHFSTEERLMTQHKYEESPQHKEQHKALIKQVGDFKAQFESGSAMISVELMNFLRDWLTNHILKTDKKFGAALNKLGVK